MNEEKGKNEQAINSLEDNIKNNIENEQVVQDDFKDQVKVEESLIKDTDTEVLGNEENNINEENIPEEVADVSEEKVPIEAEFETISNIEAKDYEEVAISNNNSNKEPLKIKKQKKKNRHIVKKVSLVAGIILIAFVGGLLGGYLSAGNKSNEGQNKTLSADSYAPPDFLSSTSGALSVSEAIEKVKPAVVTVSTVTKQQRDRKSVV